MKKIFFLKNGILTIFCLLLSIWGAAQNKKQMEEKRKEAGDKQKLLALEYRWLKAEFALDTAYLSTLMDDSFMSINAHGTASKPDELIDYYKTISQRLRDSIFIDSFRLENNVINLYGNTAVITFIVHTFRKEKGISGERRTRFYDVLIKRNGNWKAVASQGTKAE